MTAQAREGRIAVVGTGLVRSGWAILFACAGLPVSLHDAAPGAAERAHAPIGERLQDLQRAGLVGDRRRHDDRFDRATLREGG